MDACCFDKAAIHTDTLSRTLPPITKLSLTRKGIERVYDNSNVCHNITFLFGGGREKEGHSVETVPNQDSCEGTVVFGTLHL